MSDRFATYLKMAESGDDLFCEIPASWDRLRIKQLFRIRKDIAGRLGYPVWSVTQHGLREKDITSGEGQLSMDYSKYQMLRVGDLVMNHMDLITGGVDIGWKLGVTSPDYRVFISRRNAVVNRQYFVWLFRLCYWTKKFYSLGQGSAHLGRWRLPARAFESIVVPVPPLTEQQQIAAFLDYETAKIDALIEKQQQLIALLGEKRQAVISHAVTKGLNPDAPMRDSGIEWLGEVPAHWKVTRLKFLVSHVIDCHHSTPHYDDDAPWPALRTSDVFPGRLDVENAKRVSTVDYVDRISRLKPVSGDVIYAREGGRWGVAAPVPDGAEVCLAQRVMLLRGNERMLSQFVMWSLNSPPVYHQLAVNVVGSASPHVNIGDVLEVWLAEPPIADQPQMIENLEDELSKLDLLDQQCVNLIETLQERRTALISAAVTGKIDVRDWQQPFSGAKPVAEMEVK